MKFAVETAIVFLNRCDAITYSIVPMGLTKEIVLFAHPISSDAIVVSALVTTRSAMDNQIVLTEAMNMIVVS